MPARSDAPLSSNKHGYSSLSELRIAVSELRAQPAARFAAAGMRETLNSVPVADAAGIMYVAFNEQPCESPGKESQVPWAKRWVAGVLAIAMGFGSHASMQALAPAESALASLGVSPLGYAAIAVSPIALGLVSPLLWGRLWDHDSALAYVIIAVHSTKG